jgi:hypothetical protein
VSRSFPWFAYAMRRIHSRGWSPSFFILLAYLTGISVVSCFARACRRYQDWFRFTPLAFTVARINSRFVQSPQIVCGFETSLPCLAIHERCLPRIVLRKEQVHRLRLIEPLLAHRRALQQPGWLNFECRLVESFQIVRHAFNRLDRTVEVFEIGEHLFIPEPKRE